MCVDTAVSLDILLRLKAGGILSVGNFRFAVSPSIQSVRIRRDARGLCGWDCWDAKPPVLLSSVMFGLPVLFVPRGVQQTSSDSELLSVVLPGSRALRQFIVGTDRSRDWFRLLSHCWGRAGRLRRTGRNSLRSDRFLLLDAMACHLNSTVENSDQACEQWTASQSDGAYPRPEGHGIAPVPLTTTMCHRFGGCSNESP